MRVYLVGFMGAGKTTVGERLAARLECPFVDLDTAIEMESGRTIREIFERDGEAGFRRLETSALEATGSYAAAVVATGGGVLTVASNAAWIGEHGVCVWLRPPLELMLSRAAAADRPLFESAAQARELYRSREPLYRAAADLAAEVAPADAPEEVADRLAVQLEERRCAT